MTRDGLGKGCFDARNVEVWLNIHENANIE